MNQKKSHYQHVEHEFGPVYDQNSQVLILGSFPSVKSREQQFYYGHPRNRFWKVLAEVCKEKPLVTITEKKDFLLRNRIAVWDVISACDIVGSSDSSIRNVVVNDIEKITGASEIRRILCNGDKAYQLFLRFVPKQERNMEVLKMPSTSPANAAFDLERLCIEWRKGMKGIKEI